MDRNTPLYDTKLTDRERAEYLVSRMTLEETFSCFTLWIRNERLGISASVPAFSDRKHRSARRITSSTSCTAALGESVSETGISAYV